MLYIEQSLGPDEELVYVGEFHWIFVVQAFMAIVWGVVGALAVIGVSTFFYQKIGWFPPKIGWIRAVPYLHPGVRIAAFLVFILGLLGFAQMMVIRATTEIAITNHRIVYKRGLVARNVWEIGILRIEGVHVMQSILGRLLDYGQLVVRGTGVGEIVLPAIAEPVVFRKAIETAKSMQDQGKSTQDDAG